MSFVRSARNSSSGVRWVMGGTGVDGCAEESYQNFSKALHFLPPSVRDSLIGTDIL